jgi:hypothetical protein
MGSLVPQNSVWFFVGARDSVRYASSVNLKNRRQLPNIGTLLCFCGSAEDSCVLGVVVHLRTNAVNVVGHMLPFDSDVITTIEDLEKNPRIL